MKRILGLLLVFFFIGYGIGTVRKFFSARSTGSNTENAETARYVTITPLRDGWITLNNSKYGYTVNVPETKEGYRFPAITSFIYWNGKPPSPYTGSISINLLGYPTGDVLPFIRSLFTDNQEITKDTASGADVYATSSRVFGDPAITYRTFFFVHPDGLIFSVRTETKDPEKDAAKYDEVIRSFRFTSGKTESPRFLTISGKVTLTSGNCMPGSGACSSKPISTWVYAFPQKKAFPLAKGSDIPDSESISKTRSDLFGQYRLRLPPGSYSLFADLNGKKVNSSGDGFGFVGKITVYRTDEIMNLGLSTAAY